MKISRREIFPIVLGLADGTCTALVLASQKMMMGGIDVWQAFRIGIICIGLPTPMGSGIRRAA